MTHRYSSTEPKPHQSALAPWQGGLVKRLFLVVDMSDGDSVVGIYRSEHLAERVAASCGAYRVRDYVIGG